MEGMCPGSHTYTDDQDKGAVTGHDRVVNNSNQGHHSSYTIHAQPKHKDPALRFFDMCPAYDDYVAQIDASFLVGRSAVLLHRHRVLNSIYTEAQCLLFCYMVI